MKYLNSTNYILNVVVFYAIISLFSYLDFFEPNWDFVIFLLALPFLTLSLRELIYRITR